MLGELNQEQIEALLTSNVVGRIGCYADSKVYVVPVTYVYQDGYIIGHTSEGLKIHMLRRNPACCFEVDHVDNMANWQSVIANGTFEEIKGEEAANAMKKLVTRLLPLMTSQTSQPSHGMEQTHRQDVAGHSAIIYRIHLTEKTGRFEKRT
jgi:hypothetical protein